MTDDEIKKLADLYRKSMQSGDSGASDISATALKALAKSEAAALEARILSRIAEVV